MRFRALAVVLSLVCLLAGPRAFADKPDADKDADKKTTEKKSTEKKPTEKKPTEKAVSGEQSKHEHSGGTTTHHPDMTSTQGSSEHAHHAPMTTTTTTIPTPATTVHDGGTAGHHPAEKAHAETVHSAHTQYQGTHAQEHHAVVNREHLHERLQAHPTVEARHHAYERYRTEHAQFTHHAPAIHFVTHDRIVLKRIVIVPTTYHYRRTVFYDEYGWQAPVYVYSYYPRYGLWDTVFLMFALDHIADEQYAMMFYHHQREEEMQRWMADSDRLAADNQELRDKLDAMKLQMARLEENGLDADPSYVPPDAQDVALSPEVIDKLTSSN